MVNLKTKANLQIQFTDSCGQAAFLLLLTAQHLTPQSPPSKAHFLLKIRIFFFHPSYQSAWFALQTPLPASLLFLQYFLCLCDLLNAQVPNWGVQGAVFPGWTAVSLVGSINALAVQDLGNTHLPCKVQDAITSCYKCQTFGFLCI